MHGGRVAGAGNTMPRRENPTLKARDDDFPLPRVNLDLARAEPMTPDERAPRRP